VLSLVAALLFAAALRLAVPSRRRGFLDVGRAPAASASGPAGSGAGPDARHDDQDLLGRHRLLVSLLSGIAPVLLVGGYVGVAGGAVAVVVVHRLLGRREPAGSRRRRELIGRGLPQVVDLLAVALAAGAAPSQALAVVAGAVDGPIAEELESARRGLALGRDPARVWREVAARPGLAALGRTMARAVETGASVSDALHRLAEDLQGVARSDAEARARTVGVRAAAPLGLCLLPAFVLVGVVPLVAGTVTSLLGR
jgi:Flp pilus assembly protein TadB